MATGRRSPAQIGSNAARRRLGELLSAVHEHGESITITRRGVPVARLVPVEGASSRTPADLLRAFLEFQDAHPWEGVKVSTLVEEGRRI